MVANIPYCRLNTIKRHQSCRRPPVIALEPGSTVRMDEDDLARAAPSRAGGGVSPDGEKLIPQKRGQRIAMTPDELDEFLRSERVCRLATISAHGPHVCPVWFVWEAGSVWVSSLNRSHAWLRLQPLKITSWDFRKL